MFTNAQLARFVFLVVWVCLCLILFASCATKHVEYVDRDIIKYVTKVEKDTFTNNIHDSVYFEVLQKGDTVYKTKYKERTVFVDRIKVQNDTCWRDSVVTEYKENIKEVTKIPKVFWFSMIFSIIVIIFAILKVVRWIQIH